MELDDARRYATELHKDNAGGTRSYADTPREEHLEEVVLALAAELESRPSLAVETPPVQTLDEAIAHLRNVGNYPGPWRRTGSAAQRLLDAYATQREELEDLRMEQAQLRVEARDGAETTQEWKIWRRQPDGTETGHGTFYHPNGVEPFLARPDRWVVKRREVHTWKGPWGDVSGQPEDADLEPVPLAEQDGSPS